ncbi:hypothetical protein LguiB_002329 [Lonicera macranthoides]
MESILANRAGQKQKVVAEKPEMEDEEKKRGGSGGDKKGLSNGGGSGSSMKCCQAENCTVDLSDAKQYHKRHKVCELHAKAPVVVVAGILQRFCQQCSRTWARLWLGIGKLIRFSVPSARPSYQDVILW